MMRLEQLQTRLEALTFGDSEVLSRLEFAQVFGPNDASSNEQKLAAAELGESRGRRVLFTGEETIFAVFTRRQSRRELRLGQP